MGYNSSIMLNYTNNYVHLLPEMPVMVRDSPQERAAAPHTHDYIEIVLVHSGHGLHCLQDSCGNVLTNSIIKGDIFTVLPGEIHFYCECEHFRIYNICVDCEFFASLTDELNTLEKFQDFFAAQRSFQINQLHLTPMDFLRVESLLRQLMHCKYSQRSSYFLAFRVTFLQLMLELFDGMSGWKKSPAMVDDRLFTLIEKLEAHPEEKIDLEKLAKENGMSVSKLAHKFKDIIGMAPIEYCNLLRLERSRRQLEETNLSLNEIAATNGFCDSNYLGRLFKKRYGIPPASYRKKQMFCSRDQWKIKN